MDRLAHQPARSRPYAAFRILFEIQHDRFLVAAADRFSHLGIYRARTFNPDDLGAHVRKDHAAHRRGANPRQFDNL